MQNATMKVSVIIPAFNEENYITRCLEAISEQDYTNYEVIIVNNASTDNTAYVTEQFIKNKNLNSFFLLNENRKGTNHARECARLAASGNIIAQLDADCIPDKHWISNGMKALQSKNTVAATGAYYYSDCNIILRSLSLLSQLVTYPIINTLVQKANRGAILIGGNTFVYASILADAGGYNTDLTFYGDDVDIANRLAKYGHISYSPYLTLNSSYRRFNALGFWKVNKKYQDFFWNIIFKRDINPDNTIELVHPR